jgi:hypothetical protein
MRHVSLDKLMYSLIILISSSACSESVKKPEKPIIEEETLHYRIDQTATGAGLPSNSAQDMDNTSERDLGYDKKRYNYPGDLCKSPKPPSYCDDWKIK